MSKDQTPTQEDSLMDIISAYLTSDDSPVADIIKEGQAVLEFGSMIEDMVTTHALGYIVDPDHSETCDTERGLITGDDPIPSDLADPVLAASFFAYERSMIGILRLVRNAFMLNGVDIPPVANPASVAEVAAVYAENHVKA